MSAYRWCSAFVAGVLIAWTDPSSSAPALAEPALPPWLPNVSVQELDLALPGDRWVRGHLDVSLTEPGQAWVARSNGLWITGPLPAEFTALSPAFEGISGSARIGWSGEIGAGSTHAVLSAGSRLQIDQWRLPDADWSLQAIDIIFGKGTVQAEYQHLTGWPDSLQGSLPVTLEAEVTYPGVVKTQIWTFDGELTLADEELQLEGQLRNASGLGLDLVMGWSLDGSPDLALMLEGEAASVGEAMAGTLIAWPAPLTFSGGKVSLNLDVRLAESGPEGSGSLAADDVSGLTNRTAWSGLDGDVELTLADGQLSSHINAELDTINPGIPFGPVAMQAQYRADTGEPLAGELSLVRATSGFLGGLLRVKPQQWSLADLPVQATVWLNDLQLAQLMQVYPTEGLDGSGVLEGQVPITVGADGVSVNGGQVTAKAPGGTLSLPADRLQSLAANNEAMALVVDALQNFNYSVLSSTIDYDQKGQLNLGLRLEGESPQVRQGQPIVVNINLEEDIPALMTSLQLSGRVNEAVAERVRQLMERRQRSDTQDQ